MKTTAVRDKHVRLNQAKIEKAREILNAKTETEAMERALDLVINMAARTSKRSRIMKRMLDRKESLPLVKGDVSDWIRAGREERDTVYEGR